MAAATSELTWLKAILSALGISHHRPMTLEYDNTSALHIASNPVFHERTKDIEVDCHYVRDKLKEGLLATRHIRSSEQAADILTKALGQSSPISLASRAFGISVRKLEGEC